MTNGNDQDLEHRMKRTETIIAALADIQMEMQSELRTLTKSQVLMSESIGKMAAAQAHADERAAARRTFVSIHRRLCAIRSCVQRD